VRLAIFPEEAGRAADYSKCHLCLTSLLKSVRYLWEKAKTSGTRLGGKPGRKMIMPKYENWAKHCKVRIREKGYTPLYGGRNPSFGPKKSRWHNGGIVQYRPTGWGEVVRGGVPNSERGGLLAGTHQRAKIQLKLTAKGCFSVDKPDPLGKISV